MVQIIGNQGTTKTGYSKSSLDLLRDKYKDFKPRSNDVLLQEYLKKNDYDTTARFSKEKVSPENPHGSYYVKNRTSDDGSGGHTLQESIPQITHVQEESSQPSYEVLPSYAPIPTPEFPGKLDAETIARLGEEAKNYANLAFAPGFEQLDQNLVNAERRAIEEEEAVKPVYWQSMRDAIGMGATAAVRALQGANQLGRLRGGQPGEVYAGLEQSGLDQASGLEYQLGERVSDIYQNKTEVEEDIDRARVGMKKEQGLTEAVQRAQLMREELEREIGLIQMTFENRLASSADARDWQNSNVAYMQFKQNAEQALWERGITERQLAAELQSQKLSNQLTLSKLNASDALTPWQEAQIELEWAQLDQRKAEFASTLNPIQTNDPFDDWMKNQTRKQIVKELGGDNYNYTPDFGVSYTTSEGSW